MIVILHCFIKKSQNEDSLENEVSLEKTPKNELEKARKILKDLQGGTQ